ncbi:MAG: EAL domain-containing protein [Clostridiaceae bacterium]|nr:EAL domain-containing protein [Clostridiaceae bacterium]
MLIPCMLCIALTISSPWSHWIFYIDASHAYRRGPYNCLLFGIAALYILACVIHLIVRRRSLPRRVFVSMISFIFIILAAIIIEKYQPEYILIGFAATLGVTMMSIALETPRDLLDAQTQLFNLAALERSINEMSAGRVHFRLAIYMISDSASIRHSLGQKCCGPFYEQVAQSFEDQNHGRMTARLNDNTFALLTLRDEDLRDLRWAADGFPASIRFHDVEFQFNLYAAVFDSVEIPSADRMLTTVDLLLSDPSHIPADRPLYVTSSVCEELEQMLLIVAAVNRAAEERSIEIYFQPIVDANGHIFAAEALARLYDDTLGFIPPDQFIHVAEQNGLINRLGLQILEKVCAFLSDFDIRAAGINHINVNLSAIQCIQDSLPHTYMETVQRYTVKPELICFEITETTAASSLSTLERNMNRLVQEGFSFALDDYGSGQSNLDYILQLPFQYIKVGKEILWTAYEEPRKTALLAGLASMFANMGISVVVEGIETDNHIRLLRSMGVPYMQGYYYARPMPEGEFIRFVKGQFIKA